MKILCFLFFPIVLSHTVMNSLPQYFDRGAARLILNNYMSPHTPENKAKACNDKKTVNTKDNILERTIITTVICFLNSTTEN